MQGRGDLLEAVCTRAEPGRPVRILRKALFLSGQYYNSHSQIVADQQLNIYLFCFFQINATPPPGTLPPL